jgi:hypothetical protein
MSKKRGDGRITPLGNKKFKVSVYAGSSVKQDGAGRKKWSNKYKHRTVTGYKEAQRVRNTMLIKKDRGELTSNSRITVSDYLDMWLETVKPRLAGSTHEQYKGMIYRYVYPTLGSRRLAKLDPLSI